MSGCSASQGQLLLCSLGPWGTPLHYIHSPWGGTIAAVRSRQHEVLLRGSHMLHPHARTHTHEHTRAHEHSQGDNYVCVKSRSPVGPELLGGSQVRRGRWQVHTKPQAQSKPMPLPPCRAGAHLPSPSLESLLHLTAISRIWGQRLGHCHSP